MTWLRLDDAMVAHRKTRRLLRGGRSGAGLASFGLHGLAMLHASQYLTDGFVEREFVEETLDDANVRGKARTQLVQALVDNGQWLVCDGGWMIHDYLDHNPSRADVEERRARDAERKLRGRNASSTRSPRGQSADGARTDNGVQAESDRPVPSRPVPSTPDPPAGGGEGGGGAVVVFARRRVPRERLELSERLLAEFNAQAGTSHPPYTGQGKASESLRRIIGALTDRPDTTEEHWVAAIRWRMKNPYWDGKPDTGVVFGPKAVATSLESAHATAGPSLIESFREHKQRLREQDGAA